MPDIAKSAVWRLGNEGDLSNPSIARNLAKWYKSLHEKGRKLDFTGFYDWTDVITIENIDRVAENTGTDANPLWHELRVRFAELRRKISVIPRTLVFNDFYWTNFVVARDGSAAMMFDFNLMGQGYAYNDVRNVTVSLSDNAPQMFLDEYGVENIDPFEVVADSILEPLHRLLQPKWIDAARAEFEAFNNGIEGTVLFENLRKWLNMSDLIFPSA